ncbi:MAG: tetratricopeptide repeat protein [Candidatus Obscuribacterales bacterium]|nr:tetratricopeptide repeat protein [Candidatus Obscuribacterales bacterium]
MIQTRQPSTYRRSLAASLLAFSLCVSLGAGQPVFAEEKSIADADELLLQGKFEAAEESYRALCKSDESGDAHAGLAVALAKQNWPPKIIEAEKLLRSAKDKYSENINLMAAAGFVSYVHSRQVASPAKRDAYLEASEALCKRAIKANPETVIAHQTLGLVKLAQDDAEGAVEPLKKSAEMNPNNANKTLWAHALLRLDPRDKDAEQLVNEVLADDKKFYPAHLEKARVLLAQGKNEDAFMQLRNIPRAERNAEWSLVEGDIYRRQGDGPAALASWKEAIRQDPHLPDPYQHMGEYYALRGDGEFAIAEMHNALEILPNDMQLRNALAELALRQDKLDVAETEYRTILSSEPDDPRALLGLARVYHRKARREGQYPPAMQELMEKLQNIVSEQSVKAQVIKPGAKTLQESIQLNEAEKALTQKRFREGREIFSQVINTHRDDAYDLLTIGELALNDGDLRSAETAYTYAKEIAEVTNRAEQGISKIQSQRNEAARQTKLGDATWKIPEVAIDHYNQALIHDPQYPAAYYGLFSLFTKTEREDSDKAIDYATAFLEAADDANPLRKEVEANLAKLKKQPKKGKSTK